MTEFATEHPVSTPADHQRQIAAWSQRADQRKRALVPLAQPTAVVKLYRIARTADGGEYVVVPVGERSFLQTHESAYPARFAKTSITGEEALTSLFLGEDVYETYTDDQVWEAARQWAETEGVRGNQLRSLGTYVQLVLLYRRGVQASPWQLP